MSSVLRPSSCPVVPPAPGGINIPNMTMTLSECFKLKRNLPLTTPISAQAGRGRGLEPLPSLSAPSSCLLQWQLEKKLAADGRQLSNVDPAYKHTHVHPQSPSYENLVLPCWKNVVFTLKKRYKTCKNIWQKNTTVNYVYMHLYIAEYYRNSET